MARIMSPAATRLKSAAAPQALYRFYDAHERLLYVGITGNVGVRWKAHGKRRPWWTTVAYATVEHFPDRASVLLAERTAIIVEKPLHNKTHNRGKRVDPFGRSGACPPGGRLWTFTSVESGYRWETPLWLTWELDYEAISDDYLVDEIDAVDLRHRWLRCFPVGAGESLVVPIAWYVEGDTIFETAPLQADSGSELRSEDFLSFFTTPVDLVTGESVRWSALPMSTKGWRDDLPDRPWILTKGGFVTEVTGWAPSAYQSSVDVMHLRRLAGV